ncbi:MAG: glycosyltransferase family 2 protein [Myxococcota bacterium]|nr:glycosyltransferase family 2 protein [Myxococcota bacterium]
MAVVIPAWNEEESLPVVLRSLKEAPVDRIIVVDNNSTDQTAARATEFGVELIFCRARGYGSACQRALDHLSLSPPEVVLFMDADGADELADIPNLLAPILSGSAELVIGSRVKGGAERGALTRTQRFGNALSCTLLRLIFGVEYSDLGPFRAIRWEALLRLEMADRDFGWTVEMQAKAARIGLIGLEIPTQYHRRIAGESKISGDLKASLHAGVKILWTIGREGLRASRHSSSMR